MSSRATTAFLPETMPTVSLMGLRLASVDWRGLVDHIFAALGTGRGGWLITANLDFLRR
jgi:UDP-N-acetyl-D-mannosaminuronic acid transferase (WecB/TagA/CpsF family)